MFLILFDVYSSDHPEIKLEVATRWDARQRIGEGMGGKGRQGRGDDFLGVFLGERDPSAWGGVPESRRQKKEGEDIFQV